ncbi:MAG: hypothetical protein QOH93_769 [Chloroflexia bacterium]|jgi:hypothetical protein|nr:hypothetical protein [Chloroflexia bacterium]
MQSSSGSRGIVAGAVIGLLALIVAVGAWVHPFLPVGPSPFSGPNQSHDISPKEPRPAVTTNQSPTDSPTVGIQENLVPAWITDLHILGSDDQGVEFKAPMSGTYIFRYVQGSYSTYPKDGATLGINPWRTAVFVYKNGRVLWNGEHINGEAAFLRLAEAGDFPTQREVEEAIQQRNKDSQTSLNAGDKLTFIAVDGQTDYTDNPGEVVIAVLHIPE